MHKAPCISPAFMSRHGSPSWKCFITPWHIKNEHCERSNPAYSRVFSIGVNGKVQKIPFFTKFLATVCFFTPKFPDKTHFFTCIQKIGIKIELLAQSAFFGINFFGKSEYGFIKNLSSCWNMTCARNTLYFSGIYESPRPAKLEMLCHSLAYKEQALWAINSRVFPRIFDRRE